MFEMTELFHTIALKRKAYFDTLLEETELNLMEVEILLFLNNYPDSNTFTEILKSKDYAKSYVSTAINNLAKKGYLSKYSSIENKKVYNLRLLYKSRKVVAGCIEAIEKFRAQAFCDLTSDELENFMNTLKKINRNLGDK